MIKFPSLSDGLRRYRLASPRAWHDRLVIWAAAALAGLAVVGFTELSDLAGAAFFQLRARATWAPLVLTPLLAVVIVALARRYAPRTAGSGIPQVMTALDTRLSNEQARQFVSLKLSLWKALLTAAGLLAGFSIGREGPSVQIAAGVMNGFRARFGPRSVVHSRDLVLAGGAAGIAAAFNAPLAGVVFAIEELSRRFEQRASGLITTAIIIGGVVSLALVGNYTYFGRLQVTSLSLAIVPEALLCAFLSGILGGGFSRLLIQSTLGGTHGLHRLRSRHPLGFAAGCGLALAVLGYFSDGAAFGSGYSAAHNLLANTQSVPLLYVMFKFVATWLSYWSGIPGGIFAPCLAIGAGLGHDIAVITGHADLVPLIAIGMVGFLAAVTQAPITSFIIVMEMVDGHSMVLSLMASALVASGVSRLISPSLYSTLSQLQLESIGVGESPDAAPTVPKR